MARIKRAMTIVFDGGCGTFQLKRIAMPAKKPAAKPAASASKLIDGRIKDLAGWRGDTALWSVEDGEIVGRSSGLDHNAFLVSDMAAADFRLTFRVKLVGDEGNSGVQFRSAPLPDGEMRGFSDMASGWEASFVESTRHHIDALLAGRPPVLSGEQGREILRFALAAQESARLGRAVRP